MKKIGIIILLSLAGVFFLQGQDDDPQKINTPKKGGKWEVGIHYSLWNINIVAPLVEESMLAEMEDIDADHSTFSFDSSGNNFGLELRFFPGGKDGSFSVGLSYERNNFRATFNAELEKTEEDHIVTGSGKGDIEVLPHSFNISFRWDLWPSARVHPYIGLGFGIGAMDGTVNYTGTETTTYNDPAIPPETENIEEKNTLEELLTEEGEDLPLNFMPIIYFHIGIRGEIVNNMYLLGEVAVYNGIIFRGGLAYRF